MLQDRYEENALLNGVITSGEVDKFLRKLKNNKYQGCTTFPSQCDYDLGELQFLETGAMSTAKIIILDYIE